MEHIVETIVPPSAVLEPLDAGVQVKDHRLCRTLQEVRGRLDRLSAAPRPTFVYSLPQDVHISTITREGAKPWTTGDYSGFNSGVRLTRAPAGLVFRRVRCRSEDPRALRREPHHPDVGSRRLARRGRPHGACLYGLPGGDPGPSAGAPAGRHAVDVLCASPRRRRLRATSRRRLCAARARADATRRDLRPAAVPRRRVSGTRRVRAPRWSRPATAASTVRCSTMRGGCTSSTRCRCGNTCTSSTERLPGVPCRCAQPTARRGSVPFARRRRDLQVLRLPFRLALSAPARRQVIAGLRLVGRVDTAAGILRH